MCSKRAKSLFGSIVLLWMIHCSLQSLRSRKMDKGDMQRSVESLRHQLNIQRIPVSQSANEYVFYYRFIEFSFVLYLKQSILIYKCGFFNYTIVAKSCYPISILNIIKWEIDILVLRLISILEMNLCAIIAIFNSQSWSR